MSDNPLAARFPDAPPCVYCCYPRADHIGAAEQCPVMGGLPPEYGPTFYDGRRPEPPRPRGRVVLELPTPVLRHGQSALKYTNNVDVPYPLTLLARLRLMVNYWRYLTAVDDCTRAVLAYAKAANAAESDSWRFAPESPTVPAAVPPRAPEGTGQASAAAPEGSA